MKDIFTGNPTLVSLMGSLNQTGEIGTSVVEFLRNESENVKKKGAFIIPVLDRAIETQRANAMVAQQAYENAKNMTSVLMVIRDEVEAHNTSVANSLRNMAG